MGSGCPPLTPPKSICYILMPVHGNRASDTDLLKGSQVKLHLLCTWLKATQNTGNICIKSGPLALHPTPYTGIWRYKHTLTYSPQYREGRGQTSSPRDNCLKRPNKAVVAILRQAYICETRKLRSSIKCILIKSCCCCLVTKLCLTL